MLAEVCALCTKAVSFILICRMDLSRLDKLQRWTFVNLVPVKCFTHNDNHFAHAPTLPPQSGGAINPDVVSAIRRKIVIVTGYILCAILLRLSFATFEATGVFYTAGQANAPTVIALMNCPLCNATCSSAATPTSTFLSFTPELRVTVNLTSVPLALLIALW